MEEGWQGQVVQFQVGPLGKDSDKVIAHQDLKVMQRRHVQVRRESKK